MWFVMDQILPFLVTRCLSNPPWLVPVGSSHADHSGRAKRIKQNVPAAESGSVRDKQGVGKFNGTMRGVLITGNLTCPHVRSSR